MIGGEKYKILIVDDDRLNIEILNSILKQEYTILIAKNGETALDYALTKSPDLILLDVVMPGMSGFDTLVELKKSDLTRNIPVIFITGMNYTEDEQKGLALGAVDYIKKPFVDSIVIARVHIHIQIISQIRTIERLGMIDALTGIPNRRGFDHQLNVEWNKAIRKKTFLSMLMIDIDFFKNFNDSYGHAHGDIVLKNVASVIEKTLKDPDDFAARWGGEEFAVLLPANGLITTIDTAEQIRVNVEKAIIPCADGRNSRITVSIGVNAQKLTQSSDIDEFISKADKALYKAKNAGRNIVCSL